MIDTVKFFLPLIEYNIDRRLLSKCLSNPEMTTDKDGVERITGSLKNLKVTERKKNILHIEGSLPKFYKGHNFQPLNITELKECIVLISDTLHLPVDQMGISRIDMADCVETSVNPKRYLNCLISYPRMEREQWGTNGIKFMNKTWHISIYGKVQERLSKKQVVPINFQKKNLLRIENVYKRDIKSKFKFLDNITELYLPENYLRMIATWEDTFNRIEKVDNNIGKLDSLTNHLDYFKLCMIEGMLKRGGALAVTDDLDALYDLHKYEHNKSGRTKLRRHKREAIRLMKFYLNLNQNFRSLKDELCTKVQLQAKQNREMLIQ